jgi:hypothetical protein
MTTSNDDAATAAIRLGLAVNELAWESLRPTLLWFVSLRLMAAVGNGTMTADEAMAETKRLESLSSRELVERFLDE